MSDPVVVDVLGVRRQLPADDVVVLLLDGEGRRVLPIAVGVWEGRAIATAHAGVTPERPMTHDLLAAALVAAGTAVAHVEIVALERGVFHAEVVLTNGARVDSRASDAIALAVRVKAPVLCAERVLADVGVPVEDRETEREVEEFRTFLDAVSPEDFGRDAETGGGATSPST